MEPYIAHDPTRSWPFIKSYDKEKWQKSSHWDQTKRKTWHRHSTSTFSHSVINPVGVTFTNYYYKPKQLFRNSKLQFELQFR